MFSHLWGSLEKKEMTLFNSCLCAEELASLCWPQIIWGAKEAIHIWRLDPNLNRNIGKMSIPHCFDPLIGAKAKHPQVGLPSQAPNPVHEVAPPSQIPGLNLTQFNEIWTFRPNQHQFIPRHSTRACRAKALKNWVICPKIQIPNIGQLFST